VAINTVYGRLRCSACTLASFCMYIEACSKLFRRPAASIVPNTPVVVKYSEHPLTARRQRASTMCEHHYIMIVSVQKVPRFAKFNGKLRGKLPETAPT
jgi:hypothetical protein